MVNSKVLLADDDPNVREIIRLYFMQQQIELLEAEDGLTALDLATSHENLDFIILDVMMPGLDGFDACREIRKNSDVPIIMLTAKDEEIDRILGLELGADDYMSKPFSPRELVARMKAIYRRTQGKEIKESTDSVKILGFDELTIDIDRREVIANGEKLPFRPKEFDLLVYLAKSPGFVFSREQLLEQIWGYDFFGDVRTIDVHIKKIRKHLGGLKREFIRTMWGVGYKFEVEAE